MKIKPYVSIDLEFTSLDKQDAQILEIGAVYDDGVSKIEDLKTFSRIVYHKGFTNPQLQALVINGKLLKQINDIPKEQQEDHSLFKVLCSFERWLESLREVDPETGKANRLVVAGKNAALMDIPILENNCRVARADDITRLFTHRTLDVGSMYFDVFGENVSLGKINELTGRNAEVSHRALDDAFDVVYAIRHKMKMVEDK